ncbi:abortive infection family protein [Nitrosomonas sp.]|uniref:abortive infection family protein n=1 Tax=Nitrosomonas sp. TaxID=42353 RepID=UPI0025CF2E47|nr:abortive infection family protein [Nitrosomonas sp.]
MRKVIPSPVIAIAAEIMSHRETHASMDNLFMYAGAPGAPPEGSKKVKAQEWLRRANTDGSVQPLKVLGRLIEGYMEEPPPEDNPFDDTTEDTPSPTQTQDQEKLTKILGRCELQYVRGGSIVGALGIPSRTLEEFVRERDIAALEHEFNRALENVDKDPREAISAASNILETLCKVYIEEQGLEMPARQDLKPVWNVVRKDLGFDPGRVEDQDLQTILTGLFALVDGIGALRTHASSAHGAGKKSYKIESRHSRLAVHSAHTVALFVLESWERKKK